ncbi:hypothetical protein BDQ12DRAFT_673754 [Crucibulum laeve]|uniref:Uncharacterized protein n=1 Tax=Crucibulum laeve TaxID=68775 RepID=A0A5C3MKI5_9AGAR|nr:hypothetical protein BDQ12DRAFT_673754 [Crucibulum laeve]
MSTPYQFATPRIPHVPHPTPASAAASSYSLPQPKQLRPPIHNPYDKFSQNDFDAWIGGITGALRKALGQEEEAHPPQPQEHSSQDASQHSRVVPEASEDESDVGPEDSFAEFKNRGAQKGKARDPREGPGLNGVGNMDKPIEILSDDDEEEEQSRSEGEDIDDEEASQGEEVAPPPYRYGPASIQRSHTQTRKPARRDEELEEDDEEEYEEDIRESRSGSPEQIIILDSDEEAPAVTSRRRGHSDEERSSEEYSEDEGGTGTMKLLGPSSRAADRFQHVEGDEEEFSDADSDKYTGPVVIIDEGEGDEMDEIEDDEVQPLEDDTSFPPKSRTSRRPVDIPDPWYGPQTYAEDYYAGGTVRAPINAHQLGANDYDGFLTPDVRTPLELQEEEEGGEYEEYEEEQDNLDEAEDESEEQETMPSKVVQQEAFSVDDNEAEEEHLEESNARGTRPTRIPIEGDEDDRLPGSSPIPSSPIEEQYGSSASHATPTQHPIEMLQNLEGLYDEMDMDMGPLLDTGPVQNVLSDLVDWNFPPVFPAGIPTSASGHLATPSEFLSVHAESAGGTFISTQDDFFSFSVQGPTPQPTNANLSDEEEEGDEAFGRGIPLGTSDLDIPDAEEDEEGEEGDNEDAPGSDEFMEVVMPAEVEEADTEDEDESERRRGKVVLEEEVEEIIMPEGAGEPWVKKTEEGVEKVETTVEIVKEVAKEKEVEKESIMEEAIQEKIVEEGVQQNIIEEVQEQTMTEKIPESTAPGVDAAAPTIPEAGPEAVIATHEEVEQVEGIELPSTALGSPRSSPSPKVELLTEVTDVDKTVTVEVEEEVKEIAASPESPKGSPAAEIEQPAEVINNDEEEIHLPSEPQAEEQEEAMEGVEIDTEEPAQQPESPQAGPSLQPPAQPASQSQLQSPVQPAPALHPVQQHHYQQYEYEQLPTPPSERMSSADLPSEHEESPHKAHPSAEFEKVSEEDATPPGTAQGEEAELLAPSMNIEMEQENTLEKAEPEGYSVIEATSDGGYDDEYTDEDAHGDLDSELDVEEMDNDVELHERHGYTVEEPLTEGRLTEEPTTRATSLGVVSVDTEGVTREHSVAHEPLSSVAEVSESSTDAEADFQETVTEPAASGSSIVVQVEEPTPEEDDARIDEPPSKTPDPPKDSTKSLGSEIPMPVSANPSIPDPTETTEAPSRARPPRLVSLPGTPTFMLSPVGTPGSGVPTPVSIAVPQSVLNALKQHAHIQRGEGQGGLFTPGEPSDAITQEILQEVVHDEELNSEENSLEEVVEEVVDDEAQHDEMKEATKVPHEAIPPSGHSTDGSSKMPSTDASQVAAAAFALAESLPKPLSLPHRTPSSSLYPSKVTMHKSTDPILHSDPYPYSLSTPGSGFFDTLKEEESDEGTEQDNSMSSASTLDRDRDEDEDKVPDNTLEDADLDDLEFQYPTASDDDIGTVPSAIEPPAGLHSSSNIADVEDKDADGELDPEFIDEDIITQTPPSQPVIDVMQEEDPFKLMGTDSTVAPGPVEEGGSSEANAEEEVVKGLTEEAPTLEKPKSAPLDVEHITKIAKSQPSELKEVPQHGILSGSDSEGCTKELGRESPRPVEEVERKTKVDSSDVESERTSSHSSKRKRAKSPDTTAFRLTRSASSKKPPKARAPAKEKPKRAAKVVGDTIHVKPRVKGTEESISREGSEKPSEISLDNSSSGASAVGKILKPGSRASSVASTVMSDRSLIVQPSPTVHKPGMNTNRPAPPPPPPLFHAHGQARKQQQYMPPMPIQQQIHRQVTRVPSFTRASESRVPARSSPSPSTSTHPTPSHRPTPSSSSPVTRSHCRYHKISLPKEEGGPRACFLVPGCSLTDRELMEKEEIEDHGDATHEDSLRMVTDIESLDFDAYLIGILRQLVGVDILREQEVFYLPSPGEEVTRKPIRRRTASASMGRAPDSSITMTSPSLSFTSVRSPISPKAPTSVAGSTGTSFSALRRVWGSNKDSDHESLSRVTDTESELTDAEDELPKVKRLRPSPPDDNTASSSMGPPPTQTQSANKLKNRRSSKRLGVDASAYRPESDDEASSTTDDGTHSSQARRKGAKRGIKRTRATESVTAEDAENRKQKKQKTRVSGMAERG